MYNLHMPDLRILYDGWSLTREPEGPAALHLLALLEALPNAFTAVLAVPEPLPAHLPKRDNLEAHVQPAPDGPLRRLAWEQRLLPGMQRKLDTQIIHLTAATPALFSGKNLLISPTASQAQERLRAGTGIDGVRGGWPARLRSALAAGGLSRVSAVAWPQDLARFAPGRDGLLLPAFVHSSFVPREHFFPPQIPGLDLPETYVLYHGPADRGSLRRTLEAWTWAAGPIGEVYPLVMMGLDSAAQADVHSWISELRLEETVITLPALGPQWIPTLYQVASALFHPAPAAPWGGPVRHALACGKPVVAMETPLLNDLVGPAAYLVDGSDTRRLGAAIIGVIVKEPLRRQLEEAVAERVAGWDSYSFGERLGQAYESLIR